MKLISLFSPQIGLYVVLDLQYKYNTSYFHLFFANSEKYSIRITSFRYLLNRLALLKIINAVDQRKMSMQTFYL